MTPFELDYRNFERLSQSQQLSNTFTPKIEEFFETIETEDLYMTSSHSIIDENDVMSISDVARILYTSSIVGVKVVDSCWIFFRR